MRKGLIDPYVYYTILYKSICQYKNVKKVLFLVLAIQLLKNNTIHGGTHHRD